MSDSTMAAAEATAARISADVEILMNSDEMNEETKAAAGRVIGTLLGTIVGMSVSLDRVAASSVRVADALERLVAATVTGQD